MRKYGRISFQNRLFMVNRNEPSFEALPQIVAELNQKVNSLFSTLKETQKVKPNEPEIPIKIDEASKLTGLAKITLHIKCSKGLIPHYKKSGRLYFYKSELLAWINSGKRKNQFEIDAAVDAAISSQF